MKVIYTTPYGSHLYGTATAKSDRDEVQVYIPSYNDLLLQKPEASASKHAVTSELDISQHPIAKVVRDAAAGNFTALEIIFSTKTQLDQGQKVNDHWRRIWLNRHSFLTRNSKSFMGYCLSQAKKYDRRGEKKQIVDSLSSYLRDVFDSEPIQKQQISMHEPIIKGIQVIGGKEITISEIPQKSGGTVTHLSICGKNIPLTGQMQLIEDTLDKLKENYGARTAEAAANGGVDWKGMMHAVRIAEEAIEYFKTGEILFPRINSDFLLKIRNGEINYNEVSDLIDKLLIDAEAASVLSVLRQEPITEVVDDLLLQIYEENRH